MQEEMVLRKLRDMGCRVTKQRKILLNVILQEECASCKEIYYKARKEDSRIGAATVYRMINHLAIERRLAAVICIEDPLRREAAEVVASLRKAGFSKIVMMTGDSERIAGSIALKVGVDEYYSEVLPEEKADFVKKERAAGRKVIMVGDGINDSLALSAADVGIAISDGAQIAREIADIAVEADNLSELVTLRTISCGLIERIRKNYIRIVGINSGLILLGITGMIRPTTSVMAHNVSTLLIGLDSMKNLVEEK